MNRKTAAFWRGAADVATWCIGLLVGFLAGMLSGTSYVGPGRCAEALPSSPASPSQIGSPEPAGPTISLELGTRSLTGRDTSEDALDRVARLLDAMRQVESAGDDRAVGDGGRSRGPLQIGRSYWTDAWEGVADAPDYDTAVWSFDTSCLTFLRYANRYEPAALQAGDAEKLARLHNGGPGWRDKPETATYWAKVKGEMK